MDRKSIIKRLALASVSLGYGEEQSLDLSISLSNSRIGRVGNRQLGALDRRSRAAYGCGLRYQESLP